MSFVFCDSPGNFTCNYWLLTLPTCSEAILNASVVLFLMWKDLIKKKRYHLHLTDLHCVTIFISRKPSFWFSSFIMWLIFGSLYLRTSKEEPLNIKYNNWEEQPWRCVIVDLLDPYWEVIGPFYCFRAWDSQECILHGDRPQQPGHPLSSGESKEPR